MDRQQLLLKQELTVAEILRTYGKQFKRITERYTDGLSRTNYPIIDLVIKRYQNSIDMKKEKLSPITSSDIAV